MLAQPVFEVGQQLRFSRLRRRGGGLANFGCHKKIPEMLGAENGVMITPPAFVPRTPAGPEVLAERRQIDASQRSALFMHEMAEMSCRPQIAHAAILKLPNFPKTGGF